MTAIRILVLICLSSDVIFVKAISTSETSTSKGSTTKHSVAKSSPSTSTPTTATGHVSTTVLGATNSSTTKSPTSVTSRETTSTSVSTTLTKSTSASPTSTKAPSTTPTSSPTTTTEIPRSRIQKQLAISFFAVAGIGGALVAMVAVATIWLVERSRKKTDEKHLFYSKEPPSRTSNGPSEIEMRDLTYISE